MALRLLGAQVRLTAFGPGPSAGARDQAEPATLIFCGAYLAKVRDENNPSLRLPTAPEDARFFELGVELQIEGATEGGSDVNDRVDVPLSTTTFFDVRLTDDKDFPHDNERYELELFDGSTLTGVTDEEGRVRLNPIPEGRCILTLPEVVQGPEEGPESGSEAEEEASADA